MNDADGALGRTSFHTIPVWGRGLMMPARCVTGFLVPRSVTWRGEHSLDGGDCHGGAVLPADARRQRVCLLTRRGVIEGGGDGGREMVGRQCALRDDSCCSAGNLKTFGPERLVAGRTRYWNVWPPRA